jgi:hypothetical protein
MLENADLARVAIALCARSEERRLTIRVRCHGGHHDQYAAPERRLGARLSRVRHAVCNSGPRPSAGTGPERMFMHRKR